MGTDPASIPPKSYNKPQLRGDTCYSSPILISFRTITLNAADQRMRLCSLEDVQDVILESDVIQLILPAHCTVRLSIRESDLLPLIHWGRMTHICVSILDHHWFRWWLVAYSARSHYLNQCWVFLYWTLMNKFLWSCYQSTNIFFQENASENIVCETAAILHRPQCVKLR